MIKRILHPTRVPPMKGWREWVVYILESYIRWACIMGALSFYYWSMTA